MQIGENKVISVIYELRKDNENGEIVESLNENQPLVFLYGSGSLLPKFEENLSGLKTGDIFEFSLQSDEAYGEVQEDAIVDVPRNIFTVDGTEDPNLLKPGNAIPMLDRDGNRLNGIVKEIAAETVKMDFNHPMAGSDLFFSGKVTSVREANEDELTHGHVHSSGSCSGCDSDDCHGKHHH